MRQLDRFLLLGAAAMLLAGTNLVSAQDIRGLEVCTAEKDLTRRTSCLQANVQFLQGALDKASRDAADRLAAASREIAAQKAELASQKADIGALRDALAKVEAEVAELRKAKPAK
jgi:hypothetical protein